LWWPLFGFFWLHPIELCHDLLKHHCDYFEHVIQRLFTLGVWTDWLGTCSWLCRKGGRHSFLPLCRGRPVQPGQMRLLLLVLLCVVAQPCHEGQSWGGVIGRKPPFWCSLGRSLRLSLSHPAPWCGCTLDSWRDEVPLHPPTGSCSMSVSMLHCPFWALLVHLTAPTPHTCRLLAVILDMAEFLAGVTLHEASLSFVCLYPDCNMAKACQF
jgi:hypothetical protein